MRRIQWAMAMASVVVLWLGAVGERLGAAPVKVRDLRVQKLGPTTYFHVRFDAPPDLRMPQLAERVRWWTISRPELARLPQLLPQDEQTKSICLRVLFERNDTKVDNGLILQGTPRVEGLDFFGKVEGKGVAKLLLVYPIDFKGKHDRPLLEWVERQGAWVEEPVVVDFARAKPVPLPAKAFQRQAHLWPDPQDLEGQWAAAQAAYFAVMEAQAPDFGFYGFARQATGRRFLVPSPSLPRPADFWNRDHVNRRLYDLTTGTTAIAESLALQRMRDHRPRPKEQRTIDISQVAGIDIPEHPWVQMMAGKKPAPEPLAKLVPHDNYYLHFKNIVKYMDAGDLLNQWGTPLMRAFEVNSRDVPITDRLEQQLCLKSGKLTRLFGASVVKSMCLTGSDPYFREGSDVTVIFHLANKAVFVASNEPYIQEARKLFGKDLQEGKSQHLSIAIDSFTTPLREVSLHRAIFDDYAVYSNSHVALRRVLETHLGKRKALWDSLDFQYMRTVFRLDDPGEDGFLFLSDPFIRNLVGPATRIKERRRLEALTSLYMVTNAALYHAWETGKLPPHHQNLMALSGLKVDEIFAPDGTGAMWDSERQVAVSDVYNTIHFATPLIEIPIDKITQDERQDYEAFRSQYLGLWRQFFDPIGIRLGFTKTDIRWETFILPLVKLTQYNNLRRLTGDGTITIDSGMFSPSTLAQFFAHISPKADERQQVGKMLTMFAREVPGLNWLGDWFTVRLDDSPVYGKLLERAIRRDIDPLGGDDWQEDARLFFQIPLTVGMEIRNPLVFAGVLAAVRKAITDVLPGSLEWEPMKEPYKGITMVEIKAKPNGEISRWINGNGKNAKPFTPALYYALVDGGWYLSLSQEPLQDIIDRAIAKKEGKLVPGKDKVEANAGIYLSPQAAGKARDFAQFYLEWESHRRAVANTTLLLPLYRAGLLKPNDSPEVVQSASLKYFGFAPVSPDYAPYFYDPMKCEVCNKRHGSLCRPKLYPNLDKASPLNQMLENFLTIRADMRFQEDGLYTVLTFKRK